MEPPSGRGAAPMSAGSADADAVERRVRAALSVLERASDDWRNGGGCECGPLHWPVAVSLAKHALRQALEALGERAKHESDERHATGARGEAMRP